MTPAADEWIEHDGRKVPANVEDVFEVKFPDGTIVAGRVEGWWSRSAYGDRWNDIVAYRVSK